MLIRAIGASRGSYLKNTPEASLSEASGAMVGIGEKVSNEPQGSSQETAK